MIKIPKWLIEFEPPKDWEALQEIYFDPPCQPSRPVWICRTRNPYALARVDISGGDLLAGGTCHLHVTWWPPLLETPTAKIEKMTDEVAHAVCEFYDISPADITQPEYKGLAADPPNVLHLWSSRDREYLLQPHAEHLWRLRDSGEEGESLEWLRDWGQPLRDPNAEMQRLHHWLTFGQTTDDNDP